MKSSGEATLCSHLRLYTLNVSWSEAPSSRNAIQTNGRGERRTKPTERGIDLVTIFFEEVMEGRQQLHSQ